MCILCVVQRWSRRVATMLPWLVLPLILLWALSQLLPPSYRFEVTSPRLACVSVLLLTLFWYEILLPRLSLWRARRSARLREERRTRALELQKLRKTATRRCRNCHNPYRDQNPGVGGRFMCSYCGHISKRPVLDLPPMPMMSDCSQDWGNAPAGDPRYWLDLRCSSTEKSYSGFSWRLFSCFYASLRWLWSVIFRSRDGDGMDLDHKRAAKRGENEGKMEESRGEKARRKAEEKRLARLEKEMLEEEEKKQREEVARLVEERRRLRDEKAEAEERSKGVTPVGEKEGRKEAERRRQERKKEKDKGSSKSNSDCEDLDRRVGREGERKREFDRRSEVERRDATKGAVDTNKSHNLEANSHGIKPIQSKTKYFGRMTGSLLSSSRGFSGTSFFGRSAQAPAPPISKAVKPFVAINDQNNVVKRDAQPAAAQAMAKCATHGETINSWANPHQAVSSNTQPRPTGLKKSWHQLFTRSASVSPCPDGNASTCEKMGQPKLNSTHLNDAQKFLAQYPPLENQLSLSQSMHFPGFPPVNGALNSMPLPHFPAGHMPFYKEQEPTLVEEPEHFEEPCYDPDAIALLGPVSESLDNFPPDLGGGFVSSDATSAPHGKKPSPIESPLSKSRVVEEKHIKPSQLSYSSIAKGQHVSNLSEATNEQGTWQMWSTPLVQDSLGLHGPQSQWLPPKVNQFNHGIDQQNGGTYNPLGAGLSDNDLWLQKAPFQQLPLDGDSLFLPRDMTQNAVHKDLGFGSPNKSVRGYPFEPPGHSWSKEEWATNGLQEASQTYSPRQPVGGGIFSTNPDVQSVWSFNQKGTA